eukprot:357653-Rhodomonas_salina.1
MEPVLGGVRRSSGRTRGLRILKLALSGRLEHAGEGPEVRRRGLEVLCLDERAQVPACRHPEIKHKKPCSWYKVD